MKNLPVCKIRYDHVGYGVLFPKKFFVAFSANDVWENGKIRDSLAHPIFRIQSEQNQFLFTDKLKYRGDCGYTDEVLFEGDFSKFQILGRFRIVVLVGEDVLDRSHFFEISSELLYRQLKANVKSFYFQRSGVELSPEFAGKWARPAAHIDDKLKFHSMMNREGSWNAHGGWYDAGDYGKYIVNGGVSVATLMLACELQLSSRNLSAILNGEGLKPSFEQPFGLLEEIRFELEFFLRMQDEDGGVFFKVTPGHWDGFMMPIDSDTMQKRFVMGKSTTSTLNFAGVMAQAHHVFKATAPYGKDSNEMTLFAESCLSAAVRAYAWALANPHADYPHNTEGSGGYGDEHFEDEFFWARAMLFREFCDPSLKNRFFLQDFDFAEAIKSDLEQNPMILGLNWRDTQNLGWLALAFNESPDLDSRGFKQRAFEEIFKTADEILRLQNSDAYGISIRKFIWGSNGEIANHALTLLVAFRISRKIAYRDAALELVHFIYGRNPVDVSFVTGSAWSSPMFPHHRICHSDGVESPIPGLLVGGINNDRQDLHRMPHYPGDLPGLAYTDERCSFASNETAINWNAPLTTVLALLLFP